MNAIIRKRVLWRRYYTAQFWLQRSAPAIVMTLAYVLIVGLAVATVARTASIYAPNLHVPFLTVMSATRG